MYYFFTYTMFLIEESLWMLFLFVYMLLIQKEHTSIYYVLVSCNQVKSRFPKPYLFWVRL